ncbi:hypothetical protein BJ508DRAFT_325755 [Ascobolus immersus RN42]|uniref:Uncharacterized protein n=1 Tax=Ascobolus immersus RN42 TaxID=1160509 RepID=A0A3N4I802_ASCIM|nr:hypothetical protein BJ508DRAFT_325755 [Ascobolus immersus RN42]
MTARKAAPSDNKWKLLFHGTIGDPALQLDLSRFNSLVDISKDLSDKLMSSSKQHAEPSEADIDAVKKAVEIAITDLINELDVSPLSKRCCVCLKGDLPDSCFRPTDLEADIRASWNWWSEDTDGYFRTILKQRPPNRDTLPQIWCRIYPACEGSQECQKVAVRMRKAWIHMDLNRKTSNITDSWV